jgi:hypothetical protein
MGRISAQPTPGMSTIILALLAHAYLAALIYINR